MSAERLHPADVEAIARRVAELVRGQQPSRADLVDVRALAVALGVSRDFVYAHARELGGVKLGAGPKAPWRFEVDEARRRLREGNTSTQTVERVPVLPPAGRRRSKSAGRTLAIRGGEA